MAPIQLLFLLVAVPSIFASSTSANEKEPDFKIEHFVASESKIDKQDGNVRPTIFPPSMYQEVLDSARQRTLNTINGRLEGGIFRPGGESSSGGSTGMRTHVGSPHASTAPYYRSLYNNPAAQPSTLSDTVDMMPGSRGSLQIGESISPQNDYGVRENLGSDGQSYSGQQSYYTSSGAHGYPRSYGPQQYGQYPVYGPGLGHQQQPGYGAVQYQGQYSGPHSVQYAGGQYAGGQHSEAGPYQRVIMVAVPTGQGYGPMGYAGGQVSPGPALRYGPGGYQLDAQSYPHQQSYCSCDNRQRHLATK
ncbi:hypothetical protein HDE_14267 [Halotydeus destructor]|nr:hypothetical protein HDE_14267 [Halotydeus destructor]